MPHIAAETTNDNFGGGIVSVRDVDGDGLEDFVASSYDELFLFSSTVFAHY